VENAGLAAATCMTKFMPMRSILTNPLVWLTDTAPTMLQAFSAMLHTPANELHSPVESRSHISDMPPPAEPMRTQDTAPVSPKPASQEIPIAPPKLTYAAVVTLNNDKQTTEYMWPDSLLDIDMTSGDEPARTTLLPDRDVARHPAVQRALTSLALGRTVEQDRDDIMAGMQLPVISNPLLPSLVPLNEEESLLFSRIKPLQGDALVAAAGITADDLPAPAPRPDKGKGRSNTWFIPETTPPGSEKITPHTQEPQFDTRSTSDTYEDLPFSQNLKRMVSAYPDMSEEHLSITLEKHKNDLPTALAWMQTIADMKHLRRTLVSAFPTASIMEVEETVKQFRGDFMLSFNLLDSKHEPTSDWLDFAFARRRGVMDIGTDAPDFIYDDPATRSFENQWWRTCIMIRRHRISHSPRVDTLWPKLTPIAIAPRPISPRFLKYVNDLGNYNTNRPLFTKAVGTLRAQRDFRGLVALLGEPRPHFKDNDDHHPALAILHVLVGDGLASPAAAAWLALCVFKDPDMYDTYVPLFYGFSAIRRKVWNDRNVHMAASAKAASTQGSAKASRISAADAKETYASTVPGTIKHALEKQRQKQATGGKATKGKADKTSVESRGSRKSKRIKGLSPSADIPEDTEEAREEAPEETLSTALEATLASP